LSHSQTIAMANYVAVNGKPKETLNHE
jgi:hypothetical protein